MLSIWKRFFTKNWELKLVSLLLAMIVWVAVIGEEKTKSEKTLTVNLEIHNRPEQMLLVERPPATVDVIIRASQRLLPEITAMNVHVALDLSMATVAQTQYALSPNMVSVPPNAEVKDISPSLVTLRLENRREITIPVEAESHGELPEGVKLVSITCNPSEITIYGPESKISDRLKAKTSLVDLSQITESMTIPVNPILPDPELRLVDSQQKIQVRLVVEKIDPPGEEDSESPPKKKKAPSKK
jgi:YbbR domain-containing protein